MSTERTLAITALATDPEFRALAGMAHVRVALAYDSTANLLGRNLYAPHDCAWLHVRAAAALERAAAWLARARPGLELLVLDAVRPQRVQELFWAHVEGTPMEPYFAPPERGSMHSFGMAVDATVVDAAGVPLDMGSPFDDTSDRAHPALEHHFAARGELGPDALANRRLLRTAMMAGGLQPIGTEWWHFDCGERAEVRRTMRRVV